MNTTSQWSHWNASFFSAGIWLESDFFFKNSCRRFAFLLRVDGLFLFLAGKVSLPSLVSKEKVNVVPMVRENWNLLPWLASAWQKSMHLVAKTEFSPLDGAVIVGSYF